MTSKSIAAFDQDLDGAISALRSAIRHGLRARLLLDDPLFESLATEQRFLALREDLEEIIAEEHEDILQLICFDNPVPDEWQPLPETCDDVVDRRRL